ncbi:ABC transporter permease [Candidatus Saccharibacteria bacterium]|nr:ABC transporter permease [Candidatus Saccharibacteria bacterium]
MLFDNFNMALSSIRSSRLRSFLTLLGVIIGVVSVITSVSLGEGVKRQISDETNKFGSDVLTVRPGKALNKDQKGLVVGINVFGQASTTAALTESDLGVAEKTNNVEVIAPLNLVTGLPKYNDRSFNDAVIIGTSTGFPKILSQDIEFGRFFDSTESEKKVAVIGAGVAEQLFGENVPLSKSFNLRGHEFIVYGVFERFKNASISQGIDFNNAIFIPYSTAKSISGGTAQFYELLVKADSPNNIDKVSADLEKRIANNRAGQEDFTILRANDTQTLTSTVIDLITLMVGGIAIISMLVGGIGIMNIMLVSVTERTREIGLRKAIGATNGQIMSQFLIEATVLSIWGAGIGVIISGLLNLGIRIFTNLQPVIQWEVVVFACGVSIIIGIIFGLAPAVKAARKDPIDALRSGL